MTLANALCRFRELASPASLPTQVILRSVATKDRSRATAVAVPDRESDPSVAALLQDEGLV
jgi:hypothetical protein